MPIDATLERLVLTTPQPAPMAAFYAHAFGYVVRTVGQDTCCEGAGRSLWLRAGTANRLLESHFRMTDAAALERFAARVASGGTEVHRHADNAVAGIWIGDPDGRRLNFRVGTASSTAHGSTGSLPPARLQHYAVRSPSPQALADFYIEQLGFTPSDWVRDADGDLTAVFLRTDAEHHVLAIFRSPETRFDHFACETRDWTALRDWADHMARQGVLLAWGVGRHGPGNDTFFMVKDPDGNMAEISAELEQCDEDRPAGQWPHSPQTLNLWGQAIMRS